MHDVMHATSPDIFHSNQCGTLLILKTAYTLYDRILEGLPTIVAETWHAYQPSGLTQRIVRHTMFTRIRGDIDRLATVGRQLSKASNSLRSAGVHCVI